MKKSVAVFLTIVLVLLTVSCGAKTEMEKQSAGNTETKKEDEKTELVVCVESQELLDYTVLKSKMYQYIDLDCDRVVFKVLPTETADRQAFCERMRVEIMSGGGPDVFILSNAAQFEGVVFSNLEKTMRSGHFLPLDDYIENWETDLFQKQSKVIMDAGKTEEGQVVLPLLYTLPVYVTYKNETIDSKGPFRTWDVLSEAAQQDETIAMLLSENRFSWFPQRFGALGDYDAEKITLTQETLEEVLDQAMNIKDVKSPMDVLLEKAGMDGVVTLEGNALTNIELQAGMGIGNGGAEELAGEEERSALAIYNTDGGLTAQITAFSAVNRNTRYPEDAVKVASVLYHEEFQNLAAYPDFIGAGRGGVPTGENYSYYEQIKPYLEQVNTVRFYSELDHTLARLPIGTNEKSAKELSEDGLSKMKMMMAE